MSTKNLSRTVIEGGRRNVYERRRSSKDLRAAERAYLSKVKLDWENWDEEAEPEIQPVWKDFSDKLSPMYRWLDKQVGRKWSDVRSEVFENFDTRTTAGRHITFDHLLREVVETESGFDQYGRMSNPDIPVISNGKPRYYSFSDYYVDESGVLQKSPNANGRSRNYWRRPYATQEELTNVIAWLDTRIIGRKDGKLYWFSPTQGIWKVDWEKAEYGYTHYLKYYYRETGAYTTKSFYKTSYGGTYSMEFKHHGDFWDPIEQPWGYRQRGPLSEKEVEYFNSLTERVQEAILAYGKGR